MVRIEDLHAAAFYLVSLYYKQKDNPPYVKYIKYGGKYHCTRLKISLLLAIANIIHIKSIKQRAFSLKICFTDSNIKYKTLDDILVGEVIEGAVPEIDSLDKNLENNFDDNIVAPPRYQNTKSLSDSAKETLRKVFFRFGNYSSSGLAAMFNEFKNDIKTSCVDRYYNLYSVDAKKAYDFFNEPAKRNSKNEIIKFIYETDWCEKICAFDAANYIIRLFYKTGEKYRCTRTKIDKLLSIAGFVYMVQKAKPLYKQELRLMSATGGIGFNEFSGWFFPEIVRGKETETNEAIQGQLSKLTNQNTKIPLAYMDQYGDIKENIAELLDSVFMRFGNYESNKLGSAIAMFVNELSTEGSHGKMIINPQKTHDYFVSTTFSSILPAINEEIIRNRATALYNQIAPTKALKKELLSGRSEEMVMSLFTEMAKKQIEEENTVQRTYNEIVQFVKTENVRNVIEPITPPDVP